MYHTTSEKLSYYVPPTLIHHMDQGLKVAKKQLCDLIASAFLKVSGKQNMIYSRNLGAPQAGNAKRIYLMY